LSTECTQIELRFHGLKKREMRGRFNGGAISSDGGGLLPREVDKRIGLIKQFAGCSRDYRDPDLIEQRTTLRRTIIFVEFMRYPE
jgi:Transposase DDE domain group 1